MLHVERQQARSNKEQLAKGIKTKQISLETHQAPARCSEGQSSDQAVQGVPSGDKAITDTSAACVKR